MNPVQLALRVLRVDRRSRLSAVLTALGVAVGTTLVLFLATLPSAVDARLERSAWQHSAVDERNVARISTDYFLNETVVRLDVSGEEPGSDGPEYPGPGQVLLSPRLAELAAQHRASELADRFPGEVVGTIDEQWLKYPEQLVAVVGHPPGTLQPPKSGFGAVSADTSDVLLDVLSGVGVVVVAIPSMVLVASAARLTAARRERRLAALRLAGATPGQVIGVVTAETAVAAVVGTVAGLLLSWPLRHLGAMVPWGGGTWLVSDFTPSVATIALVGVSIPVLVVLAAVLGLRRVVHAPLGAAMSVTRKRPGAWRLLSLVAAAAFFLFGLATAKQTQGLGVLLASLAVVLLSASIVGPWLTGALGSLFASLWRKPSMLLAGRRLRSDPKAAYRSVSGIVLAVFVGSMALTLLPSFETFAGGGRSFQDSVLYVDVPTAEAAAGEQRIRDELERSGTAATVVRTERVRLELPDGYASPALVMSCQDAAAITRFAVADCAGPPAVRAFARQPVPNTGLDVWSTPPESASSATAQEVPLPDGVPVLPLGNRDPKVSSSAIIDPALVPEFTEHGTTTLAVKPANQADREQVRTALVRALPGELVNSRERLLAGQQTMLGDLKRITAIGLGMTVLLAGASAAITAAASVVDRRRTFSALIAAGTPVRTLGRALRTEAALPALVATIGAGVAGSAVAAGFFTLFATEPVVLSYWLLAPVVIGIAVALIASSSSGPMLRRISGERISDE